METVLWQNSETSCRETMGSAADAACARTGETRIFDIDALGTSVVDGCRPRAVAPECQFEVPFQFRCSTRTPLTKLPTWV